VSCGHTVREGERGSGHDGAGSHAGEAGEEREGENGGHRRVRATRGGAHLIEARKQVTDGASCSADGLN
jgi:hypothetical protein